MMVDGQIIGSQLLSDMLDARLRPGQTVLELGAGPGSSTFLGAAAAAKEATFTSVDTAGYKLTWAYDAGANTVNGTAQAFLRDFAGSIGFVYFDNYDWDPPGRRESELVHLEQALLTLPRLADDAVVLFDDTWFLERDPPASQQLRDPAAFEAATPERLLENYDVFGKGSLAVPLFIAAGFDVVAVSQRPHPRQILLLPATSPRSEPLLYDVAYFERLLEEHRRVSYPAGGVAFYAHRADMRIRRQVRATRTRVQLRTRLRRRLTRLKGARP